jgi:hypothetical protein
MMNLLDKPLDLLIKLNLEHKKPPKLMEDLLKYLCVLLLNLQDTLMDLNGFLSF